MKKEDFNQMTDADLLSNLSVVKRRISNAQQEEKALKKELQKRIEKQGAIQSDFFAASISKHSYKVVPEDISVSDDLAMQELIAELLERKDNRLLKIKLDAPKVAELVRKEHISTQRLLERHGLKVEQVNRLNFKRL